MPADQVAEAGDTADIITVEIFIPMSSGITTVKPGRLTTFRCQVSGGTMGRITEMK